MNVPASNQNSGRRAARRKSPLSGDFVGSGVPPYGASPTSAGASRISHAVGNAVTSSSTAPISSDRRQPEFAASAVKKGKNTNRPALVDAPKIPVTNPRRSTNHRFATVAPSTLAINPLVNPAPKPNHK